MNPDIQTALSVFLIGMFTVFVVLGLVIYTGKAVIWLVNRNVNRQEAKQLAAHRYRQSISGPSKNAHLPAIIAAVEVITEGRGRVEKIEWIENV